MRRLLRSSTLGSIAALAAAVACGSSGDDAPSGPAPLSGTTEKIPSDQAAAPVYVAKVKNVLVGLPPTDEEVRAVQADPSKLVGLVDQWMKLPEYADKMLRFFQLAFQQTQVDAGDYDDQAGPRNLAQNRFVASRLVENLSESVARTMLDLDERGRPLTDIMTTSTFMMTPALMETYAYLDARQVDSDGRVVDAFARAHPNAKLTLTTQKIAPADSIDPQSPSFMHWTYPDLPTLEAQRPGCFPDPLVLDATSATLHRLLGGSVDRHDVGTTRCNTVDGSATAPQLAPEDFTAWKMVTIRTPKAGEAPTPFYDLPKLRATNELVLRVPRVGFFSTPAFFANWATNDSNTMRVTVNQSFIVALGAQVDGTDPTKPDSTPGLDAAHADQPACVACHQTLDPSRSILASTFSWYYHVQDDRAYASQPGLFAFRGVTKPVRSIDDFARALATHPLVGEAWAQKLCFWAGSVKCASDDPEFQRVVGVFKSSGYSWRALVRELMSSPLVTNASPTKTSSDNGEVVAVARRDHLCAALSNRLGLDDVCASSGSTRKSATQGAIADIVAGLPSDGYSRGATAPVLPTEPTLFFRAGTENICSAIAEIVVDPAKAAGPKAKQWKSSDVPAAVADFVATLMAITPSDPRSGPAREALQAHFDAAVASGATPTDALRSTFVVACVAPSSISIGL